MKKIILSLLGCGCLLAAQTVCQPRRSSTAPARPSIIRPSPNGSKPTARWIPTSASTTSPSAPAADRNNCSTRPWTSALPTRPMTDENMAKAPGKILHFPVVAGGVAITYNLPGDPKLKLDGDTLANIYLGNITKWNDPKIAALNPGVNLPDLADRSRASLRRQRHHLHLHRLPEQRQPGLGGYGGQRHFGEMARRHRSGRQRQRRRRRPGQTDFRRHRLRANWPTPTRTKCPTPT